MLPSELLAVWKRKGAIVPRYARPSPENLEVSSTLIDAYKRHLGEKKKEIKRVVTELEDYGYEYRFVRGLSLLLDRRSIFRCDSRVDSVKLRRTIYEAAGKLGPPTTFEDRRQILEPVAAELKLTPGVVEELLYADLEPELILDAFEPPSPEELLKQYNLSLTQTLMFDSTEMSFTSTGNWQRIFHSIKRAGLIYDVSLDGSFRVHIDGPSSLFKLTRRYGTSIAKLIPVVVSSPEWKIEAKILWKYTNEICDFKLECSKHGTLLKKQHAETATYDSATEEDFAVRFKALDSGWHLKREPEPIVAGKRVIIPDFSFERDGLKVFMEIIGFWTEEYLQRKVEKLNKVNVDMLLAVDETLACEKLANLQKQGKLIIYFRRRIPLPPVLRYLQEAFQEVRAKQIELLRNLPITFTEPIVSYKEFAARVGTSVEAAKDALTAKKPQGYIILDDSLVRLDKVEQVKKRIDEYISLKGHLPYSEAVKIMENEQISDMPTLLMVLGYKILWRGISNEQAEVIKNSNQPSAAQT